MSGRRGEQLLESDLVVVSASAGDMIEMEAQCGDNMLKRMVYFAHVCTYKGEARAWPQYADALAADWPLVKRCAERALAASGLVDDTPGE